MNDQTNGAASASSETRAPQMIASIAIFLPLAISAVAVRLWVRLRMIRNFGWDDCMMMMALANFAVYCSALAIIVAHGGGTRRAQLDNIRIGIIWTLTAEVSYLTSILFLKLSLGLFFLRVVQARWQRIVVHGVIIVSSIIQSFHVFLLVFACGNPKYYPENLLKSKCIPGHVQVDLAYEQAAVTTLTDLIFAFLPIPLLWDTTLDRRSKLSVAFVLLLGTSGSVCSMVRFKYISGLGNLKEFFWSATNISLWSLYEVATGIIAGSLATMRPLFRKLVYKARTITQVGKTRGRKRSHPSAQDSGARMLSKKKSYASSVTSQKSVVDWSKSMDVHQTYTTSVFAGAEFDFAEALRDDEELVHISKKERRPKTPAKDSKWKDDQSIHKTVEFDVRTSSEDDQLWATAGGARWTQRMEDLLKTPPKARKGSKDSIPEWDRLPDLIPPSRKGSTDSTRAPPLIRITTK